MTLATHVLAAIPGDTVLCVGSDGRTRIEGRTDGGCSCEDRASSSPTRSASAAALPALARVVRDGNGCVDVPLSAAEEPVTRSRDARCAPIAPANDAFAAMLAPAGAGSAVARSCEAALHAPPPSPSAERLRTVVLRF